MSESGDTRPRPEVAFELAWRLRTALRELGRRFAIAERADLVCCGMTVAQWASIEAIALEGPIRPARLAGLLGVTPSTLSRNLDRLEGRGLVRRATDTRDGRAQLIALTKKGYHTACDVAEKEAEFANAALGRMDEDTAFNVIAALEQMLHDIREFTDVCCPGAFEHYVGSTFVPADDVVHHSDNLARSSTIVVDQEATRGDST